MADAVKMMEAEILAEMENNPEAYEDTGIDYLVIDNDLRTITIPPSVTNIGVESDKDVRQYHFSMPRYSGIFDLGDFTIRINYRNTETGGSRYVEDLYLAEDKTVNEDSITFTWTVGRNACRYKGTTRFTVCMKLAGPDGVVQKEFNTTPAELPALEGLEVEPLSEEEQTDVMEQLLDAAELAKSAANTADGATQNANEAEKTRQENEETRIAQENARQKASEEAVNDAKEATELLLHQINHIGLALNGEDGGLDIIVYEEQEGN